MAGILTLLTDVHIFLSLFMSTQKHTAKPALPFLPDCLLIYTYAAQNAIIGQSRALGILLFSAKCLAPSTTGLKNLKR